MAKLNINSTVKLNNGVEMPTIGFGVWQMDNADECEQAVLAALEAGYRHIDTAAIYQNEEAVGRAIKKSGISRKELFIVTKCWVSDCTYDKAKAAFETSLKKLGLDYVDLYLIHWPYNDSYGAWRAMEELYEVGKVRAIGISNFYPARLTDFFINSRIKPAVNQIEIHPYNQQNEAVALNNELGVVVESWGPIGGSNMVAELLGEKFLTDLAVKYNKTPAQIVLRWQLQRGLVAIPKSSKPERIKQNIDIFNFELSDADMEQIATLEKGQGRLDPCDPGLVRRICGM